jgi:hypothetical protein
MRKHLIRYLENNNIYRGGGTMNTSLPVDNVGSNLGPTIVAPTLEEKMAKT